MGVCCAGAVVSTWMGDHLGIMHVVGFLNFFSTSFQPNSNIYYDVCLGGVSFSLLIMVLNELVFCLITEVKQPRARLVLGWVTTWE